MPAILLHQVAARTATLEVSCRRCKRRGRLSVAQLLAAHGPNMPMTLLLDLIAADCPRMGATNWYDLCGAFYPQLAGWF